MKQILLIVLVLTLFLTTVCTGEQAIEQQIVEATIVSDIPVATFTGQPTLLLFQGQPDVGVFSDWTWGKIPPVWGLPGFLYATRLDGKKVENVNANNMFLRGTVANTGSAAREITISVKLYDAYGFQNKRLPR